MRHLAPPFRACRNAVRASPPAECTCAKKRPHRCTPVPEHFFRSYWLRFLAELASDDPARPAGHTNCLSPSEQWRLQIGQSAHGEFRARTRSKNHEPSSSIQWNEFTRRACRRATTWLRRPAMRRHRRDDRFSREASATAAHQWPPQGLPAVALMSTEQISATYKFGAYLCNVTRFEARDAAGSLLPPNQSFHFVRKDIL